MTTPSWSGIFCSDLGLWGRQGRWPNQEGHWRSQVVQGGQLDLDEVIHSRDIMICLPGVSLYAGTENIALRKNTGPVLEVWEGRGTHSSWDHTNQCINTNCGCRREREAVRVEAGAWIVKPPGPSSGLRGQCRPGRSLITHWTDYAGGGGHDAAFAWRLAPPLQVPSASSHSHPSSRSGRPAGVAGSTTRWLRAPNSRARRLGLPQRLSEPPSPPL